MLWGYVRNGKLEFVFELAWQTFHDSLYQPNGLSCLRRGTFQEWKVPKDPRNPWFRTSFCATQCQFLLTGAGRAYDMPFLPRCRWRFVALKIMRWLYKRLAPSEYRKPVRLSQ